MIVLFKRLIRLLLRIWRAIWRVLRRLPLVRAITPVKWFERLFSKAEQQRRRRRRRAAELARMIVRDLDRQGYNHIRVRRKKRNRKQRVRFKTPIICTSELAYLTVDTARLPYKVTTQQITSEECLRSLNDHCQVPVQVDYLHGEICYMVRLSGKSFPTSFAYNAYKLPEGAPPMAIPLGIGADKQHAYVDLQRMIHCLIVGPTGKGKSTILHTFLVTLADRNSADDVVLWLIDLKKSEFSAYEPFRAKRGRPGIVQRLVYEEDEAVHTLQDAFDEMKRRQSQFQRVDAADIEDYARITQTYMPRIVVVIDEVLQLMTSGNKFGGATVARWTETHLVNLAAQGRAAGIHVVIATQVVNSKVLTTRVVTNFENVICFGVRDWRQSQLAIQDSRAEGLPRGRVVLKCDNEFSEYQTCLLSPQNRRLAISRIAQSGPGVGLVDANDNRRFVNDAMLLLKVSCEQFDGEFSLRKITQAEGVRGIMPKQRVEEVARKLEQDGVLSKSARNRPRFVTRGYRNSYEKTVPALYSAVPSGHQDTRGTPHENSSAAPEICEVSHTHSDGENNGTQDGEKVPCVLEESDTCARTGQQDDSNDPPEEFAALWRQAEDLTKKTQRMLEDTNGKEQG